MATDKHASIACPTCGKTVVYEGLSRNPSFPFCCQRCKLIDLGEWLSEGRRIPDRTEAARPDEERT